jgi:hypothetical protein
MLFHFMMLVLSIKKIWSDDISLPPPIGHLSAISYEDALIYYNTCDADGMKRAYNGKTEQAGMKKADSRW